MEYEVFSLPRASSDGNRVCEDAFSVSSHRDTKVFVVADGHGLAPKLGEDRHGTARLARRVAKELCRDLCQTQGTDIVGSFARVAAVIDSMTASLRSGAVCTAVVVNDQQIAVAWVGDVSAVWRSDRGGTVELLALHHSLARPEEAARLAPLLRSGTFEVAQSPVSFRPRLYNPATGVSMSPTRSFGDAYMHPAIIAVPEVQFYHRRSGVLAIHSDGAEQAVAAAFAMCGGCETLAKTREAAEAHFLSKDQGDDATAIFVRL